jgi:hypothetical protein
MDIHTNDIDLCAVLCAYPASDLWLVAAGTDEFENLRSDRIETKHLALLDIEQDCAILRLGSPDRVGDRDHPVNLLSLGMSGDGVGIRDVAMNAEKIVTVAAIATIRAVFTTVVAA